MACGQAIVERMSLALNIQDGARARTKEQAVGQLETILSRMVRFLVLEAQSEDITSFMLREINEAGPVLDSVYREMIEPKHREICALWALATGTNPDSQDTKLAVFALFGQVLYFRIGRAVILRRMKWETVTEQDVNQIINLLIRNLHAALNAGKRSQK